MTASFFVIKFVLWVLIVYGITQIVVESSIFGGFRRWALKSSQRLGMLFSCMLCTGVWVSFMISFWIWSPTTSIFVYDIVDVEKLMELDMQITFHHYPENSFDSLITIAHYHFKRMIAVLTLIFLDGMVGSTCIWLIHVVERRLSSYNFTSKE